MSRRLALVVSLFVSSLGFWAGHSARPPPPGPRNVTRLVLARDVAAGVGLVAADLRAADVAEDDFPSDAISSLGQRLVLGQALVEPGREGRPVTFGDLVEAEAPVQKRARAAVLDITARTPWVKKADHLDVLSSINDPQTNELVTVTLLQNVIVLGAEETEKGQRLSLLVIPEEAEMMLEAQRLGQVEVTLRNPDDIDIIEERGRATVNTLLSGERARVLQQKRFNTTCCILRGRTSTP